MKLGLAISSATRYFNNRCALVCAGKSRTYAEIEVNSNRVANGLLSLGLRKEDRVALICDNSVEYIEADFALYKSGLVRVAINPMLSAGEVAHIIKDSGANAVIVSSRLADSIITICRELDQVKHYICIGDSSEETIPYTGLLAHSENYQAPWPINAGDIAMLLYTGGTTGVPKGAMHTHESVIYTLMNLQAEFWNIQPTDVFLAGGSFAHANGFRFLTCFLQGGKFIIPGHFNPKDILETVESEKVTILSTVPTTLIRLCNYTDFKLHNLESLRMVTYGTAPVATGRLEEALSLFGKKLTQSYGQAEALMAITLLTIHDHVTEGTEEEVKRLASAGRPYMLNEVRIVDNEGLEVPRGEVGEVVVKSPITMKGYWQNTETTRETLKDGWIHTGDLGTMDEDGYLFLVDRKKDMIISGGYNIYAREVEDVIHVHPAVSEAAVIGVPDEDWGESIKAFVVLKPGETATEKEIIAFTKERLASFKKPKSVEFLSALPRTSVGKISKKDLRAPYWEGQERAIH